MTEWTPQSRLRSWKANRQKYDGFGLAQVIEDYEATLASLTALREALEWIKPIHICVSCDIDDGERARRTGFNEAVALMSAALAASREHAQTHRD